VISVDEALAHVLALADFTGTETVPLRRASGRILAAPIVAARSQPPFRTSVMDGYAVAGEGPWRMLGTAAAGHAWSGTLNAGDAIRIFTGAPVPEGATRVVIQEDADRDGETITLKPNADSQIYIRDIGRDFKAGHTTDTGFRLTPATVALAAAMNVPDLTVARRPVVAIIATGDELVMPGEDPAPSQIIASNNLGLAALVEQEGAEARLLPIARDTKSSLEAAFAMAADADLTVTIGGASVGDHDLVGEVAGTLGLSRAFYKIAMRPGKPLMAGRLNGKPMLGLPGNPVSSMVCGHLFLRPLLRAMQGLPKAALPERTARLGVHLPANGPRQHYMRALLLSDGHITVAESQDSALLSVLADANALLVRPPHDSALRAGAEVRYIDW
jgi:molybdopterin molybdotransferase